MKPWYRKGWTLVEVMLGIIVLGVLLTIITSAISLAQRTQLSVVSRSALTKNCSTLTNDIRRLLSKIVMDSRAEFTDSTALLEEHSDFHFVCGDAQELLPQRPDAVGDAIFFQAINCQGELECGGLFVEWCDDSKTKPAYVAARLSTRSHFRLIYWHRPGGMELPSTTNGQPPTREDHYSWFRAGVQNPHQCSVVADDVLALIISRPAAPLCHDSRRYLWDEPSQLAHDQQNRVPQMTLQLILTEEVSWQRHPAATLKSQWLTQADQIPSGHISATEQLLAWLNRKGIKHQILHCQR
jgi:uncharacterized protein (TIGR02599 family)